MKSYLLSMLRSASAGKNLEAFIATWPHDWLIWEPGNWKPPGPTTLVESPTPPAPAVGEALALALAERPGSAQVTVGRGSDCDVPVNDGTLSLLHLVFMRSSDGLWTVRDANSRNGTFVGGRRLEPGKPAVLQDSDQIRAAQVVFTYATPQHLFSRLHG